MGLGYSLYGDRLRRPALNERPEPVERFREILSRGGKAQTKMRGSIETVAGRQQNPMLRGCLAERAIVLSADQPRKCGHSALWWNPAEHIFVLAHEAFKQLQISAGDLLGFAQHDITFADCDFGKYFARRSVTDREVGARRPVLLATPGVVLDHPAGAHAGNGERFRQIRNHRSMRKTRCRFRLPSVINRMIDFVAH